VGDGDGGPAGARARRLRRGPEHAHEHRGDAREDGDRIVRLGDHDRRDILEQQVEDAVQHHNRCEFDELSPPAARRGSGVRREPVMRPRGAADRRREDQRRPFQHLSRDPGIHQPSEGHRRPPGRSGRTPVVHRSGGSDHECADPRHAAAGVPANLRLILDRAS
jgi:hypothetical protein